MSPVGIVPQPDDWSEEDLQEDPNWEDIIS